MIKKIIKTILLIIIIIVLVIFFLPKEKQATTNTSSKKSVNLFTSVKDKLTYNITKKGDLSQDITGTWSWMASTENRILSMGSLVLKENNNKITGTTYALTSVVPTAKATQKNIRYASVSAPITNGKRLKKDLISFEIHHPSKQYKEKTIAKILLEGHEMYAKAKMKKVVNGTPLTVEYYWTATRISD